jgi:Zn-dependent protease/CBS domain-containing protein
MFGKRIPVFKLLGFEVKVELSWLILAALMIWSLASNVFPSNIPELSPGTYLWMGVVGALGLFASIVFHELCHSLVARKYGLPITGITLFIFGGVAEMEDEPPSARSEFLMALAGPASSALLSLGFYGMRAWGQEGGWPEAVRSVFGYLASLNASLAGFNLLPAFPLDGGRVLRSMLWGWKKDLWWATRIASRIGSGFGMLIIGLGALSLFLGNFVNGLWLLVIGTFLQNASRVSYQRLLLREALQGEQVQRFMKPDPVTVSPSISVRELVEGYVYKHHFKMFPVVESTTLVGCVSTRAVKEIPQAEWSRHTVGELIRECSIQNTISPTADAVEALSTMNRTGNSRLMVVEDGRLVGVITLKDMLRFLSLKMDLERVGE